MEANTPKSMGTIVEDGWQTASLMNPEGSQYKLGKNAVWVWKSCNGNATRQKIRNEYAKMFNLKDDEASSTVDAILQSLESKGLIKAPAK